MKKLIDALAELVEALAPRPEPETRSVPVRVRPARPSRDPRAY
jgi:hypothetical protein